MSFISRWIDISTSEKKKKHKILKNEFWVVSSCQNFWSFERELVRILDYDIIWVLLKHHIYIYIEREREKERHTDWERKRERGRERERDVSE